MGREEKGERQRERDAQLDSHCSMTDRNAIKTKRKKITSKHVFLSRPFSVVALFICSVQVCVDERTQ